MMALIAYKIGRNEVAIILHMLSNFLKYTLPVLILHQSTAPAWYFPVVECLYYFCLVGLSYSIIKKNNA